MNNFKHSVPESIQTKLELLAETIAEQFNSIVLRSHDKEGDVTKNDIQGNYVSGWMPRQDGGFSVDCFVSNGYGSGCYFTEKQQEFINDQLSQCFKAFLSDNDIESEMSYDELDESQQQEYQDYENEWMRDSALLQFQMYAYGYPGSYWEEKEQTINIRVSINYKDAPYYREKSAEDIKELILSPDEFLAMPIEDILKQITI